VATKDSAAVSDAVTCFDDPVRVKDLQGAHENPNIPRSVFVAQVSEAVLSEDDYVSYTDAGARPGKGFTKKSITVQAAQLKHPFDANGESGSVGDWLVHWNGHWMVVKDADMG
jgi:hypothetical protein